MKARITTGAETPVPRIEARLRAFIAAGFRPKVRSHAFAYSEDLEREGYETLILDPHPDYPDMEPRQQSIGWVVDASAMRGSHQGIIGGTYSTIEEALAYSERELAKVLA